MYVWPAEREMTWHRAERRRKTHKCTHMCIWDGGGDEEEEEGP